MYYPTFQTSQRSVFKRKYQLPERIQKRRNITKLAKGIKYSCIVIQYSTSANNYRDYEVMCVDSRLNLRVLQEFLMRKMRNSVYKFGLMFEINGKIKNPGDVIGVLSEQFSEQDGFLYLYVQSQSSF